MSDFVFTSPITGNRLEHDGNTLLDPQEGTTFHRVQGIWRLLSSERIDHYAQFIQDYELVRRSEGRGTEDSTWYQSLPFPAARTRFADDWRIRAQSFATLANLIDNRRNLNVLDLGAGNCWLSNRLAAMDHCVVAVDLLTNDFDGLGAHRHYKTQFTTVQAEYDDLPFWNNQFDLVIYNGSLHYTTDFAVSLKEAERVLKADGQIIVMDSPVYHQAQSGQQMVQEREAHFENTYGTRSNALDSEHFLTYDRLDTLADKLNVQWRIHTPNYGLRWQLRPIKARLRGHREPAKFHIIVGTFS